MRARGRRRSANPRVPGAVVTQEEMEADMLKFGIRGTKEERAPRRSRSGAPGTRARAPQELIENLRWIKNNKPDTVGSSHRRESVLPFDDFEYPELSKHARGESKDASYDEEKEEGKAEAK